MTCLLLEKKRTVCYHLILYIDIRYPWIVAKSVRGLGNGLPACLLLHEYYQNVLGASCDRSAGVCCIATVVSRIMTGRCEAAEAGAVP